MKCIQCFLACIQGLADFFCGGPGCKYCRLCKTRGNIKPHPWQKANCLFFCLTFKILKLWSPFLVWGLCRSSNLGKSGPCIAACQPVTYLVIHTVYLSHTLYIIVVYSPSHVRLFCNPTRCSRPGSSVHGISQARILEQVAISFSRGSSQPRDQTHVSYLAGGLFTTEPTWQAHTIHNICYIFACSVTYKMLNNR